MTTNKQIAYRCLNQYADSPPPGGYLLDVIRDAERIEKALDAKDALLKERDETIEELKKQITCLREWGERDERGRKAAEKDLAAERERAEAYRQVAIRYGDILDDSKHLTRTVADVDAEAHKLLAERSKEGKDR